MIRCQRRQLGAGNTLLPGSRGGLVPDRSLVETQCVTQQVSQRARSELLAGVIFVLPEQPGNRVPDLFVLAVHRNGGREDARVDRELGTDVRLAVARAQLPVERDGSAVETDRRRAVPGDAEGDCKVVPALGSRPRTATSRSRRGRRDRGPGLRTRPCSGPGSCPARRPGWSSARTMHTAPASRARRAASRSSAGTRCRSVPGQGCCRIRPDRSSGCAGSLRRRGREVLHPPARRGCPPALWQSDRQRRADRFPRPIPPPCPSADPQPTSSAVCLTWVRTGASSTGGTVPLDDRGEP